nr:MULTISPECIES: hypothetical protein [unclassified Nocardioides]
MNVKTVPARLVRGFGEHAVAAGNDESVETLRGVVEVNIGEDCQFAAILAGTSAALDPLNG